MFQNHILRGLNQECGNQIEDVTIKKIDWIKYHLFGLEWTPYFIDQMVVKQVLAR